MLLGPAAAGGRGGTPPVPHEFTVGLPTVEHRHRDSLARQGCATFGGLWDSATAEALAGEAAALFPAAEATARRAGGLIQATASDAPLLTRLHFALVPLARALTGRLLVPSYGWYNFYPSDDAIWLHVDVEKSDLAILGTVSGGVGPLHIHPELAGRTQAELDRLQTGPSWDADSGCRTAYPRRGVLALRGRSVPHHRPGRPLTTLGAVAALHFTSLL
ncbi:hypothetical protein ACFY8W_01980 [Streptomyces sp. NPDC012637]|uniref:hypothetical protein n=1 Tax=Streptomyces sp. NPDC012637 TaxID=3364842 RepID=UPI0036E16140